MGYSKTNGEGSVWRGRELFTVLAIAAFAVMFVIVRTNQPDDLEQVRAQIDVSSPNPQSSANPVEEQTLGLLGESQTAVRVSRRQPGWHKAYVPGRYGQDGRNVLEHYILFEAVEFGWINLYYVPRGPDLCTKYIIRREDNLVSHYLYYDWNRCCGTFIPSWTNSHDLHVWFANDPQPRDTYHVTNVGYTTASVEDGYYVPTHFDYFDCNEYVGSYLPAFDPESSSSGREILEKVFKDHEHFQGHGHGYDWPAPGIDKKNL